MSHRSIRPARTTRLAVAVWFSWLGIGVWSWCMLLRRELHPHPGPLLVLLLIMAAGLVSLAAVVCFALLQRQGRRAALRALCLGSVPAWLLAAHLGYVYSRTAQRLVEINPLTLTLLPVASVLAEIEAAARYPQRTEGQRVVMYHEGLESAEAIVAEADEYLAVLEARLGCPSRAKVQWIRGSVLGREYCSFGGFAMSTPQRDGRLSHVDRHELAHVAINQHLTASSRPPMVLVEGWAEACAAVDSESLIRRASREFPWAPSLSELVGPTWAWLDVGPVYSQGAVIADQLLQEFGGNKFLELYTTCRPETFDDDCQRIFGAGLAEIQQRHKTLIAESTSGKRIRRLLEKLPVADDVDVAAWHRFVDEYTRAVDRPDLHEDYEVVMTSSVNGPANGGRSALQVPERQTRVVRSGVCRLLVADDEVLAVTDRLAFCLHRSAPDRQWELERPWSPFPAVNRWHLRASFEDQWQGSFRMEFDANRIWDREQTPPTIVECTWDCSQAVPLVHIGLEYSNHDGTRTLLLRSTFSPDSNWREVRRRDERESRIQQTQLDWEFDGEALVGMQRRTQLYSATGDLVWTSATDIRIRHPPETSVEVALADFGVEEPIHRQLFLGHWSIPVLLAAAGLHSICGLFLVRRGAVPAGTSPDGRELTQAAD